MKKTHYIENGKTLYGLIDTRQYLIVKTKSEWYALTNKCEKCRKTINQRTIFI